MFKQIITEMLSKEKLVPVIKVERLEEVKPLLTALYNGGIRFAEITLRTKVGLQAIAAAKCLFPDMIVGAGTVTTPTQARSVLSAGAEFVVSPGFDASMADVCNAIDVPYMGGCVTPSEIMLALSKGAEVIKFFPAEAFGGLKAIKALSAAFPTARFMPTGGISAKNIMDYLAFDKVIACGGSWMVTSELLKAENYAEIERLSREAVELIRGGRV